MSNPSPINEIIMKNLKSLGEDFYIKYLRQSIFYNWKEIVGEANAKRIKPLRIEYKRLYVYASDSSWRSNVYAYKSTFIKKINDFIGENLIDDIIFGNPSERPMKDDDEVVELKPTIDESREIRAMSLTDEELDEIDKNCACIEDEQLRATMLKTSISRAKLEKYRLQKGWHTCPRCCKMLCLPEREICDVCEREEYEVFEKFVMKILMEVPWSTYAEIRREIANKMPHMLKECSPEFVESTRGILVQQICRSLDNNDQNRINLLVMLFKGVKPEDLSEKLINKTLYELRYDLPMKGRIKFAK